LAEERVLFCKTAGLAPTKADRVVVQAGLSTAEIQSLPQVAAVVLPGYRVAALRAEALVAQELPGWVDRAVVEERQI
jgi:hypothetical protein